MNAKKNDKKAMPAASDVPVQVKKVRPYPISCGLVKAEGQPMVRCQIVKLTEVGFLIRIGFEHLVRVGDNLTCQFSLPSMDKEIKESVKVIKTYLGMDTTQSILAANSANPSTEKVSTLELHFRSLSPDNRTAIQNFTKKIGQK